MIRNMRIGFLSDLHITNNTAFIGQALDGVLEACKAKEVEKLFIAGDTTNDPYETLEFVDKLTETGVDTYTIFGNHEYWAMGYRDMMKNITHEKYLHGKSLNLKGNTVLVGLDGTFDHSFVLKVDNKYTKCLPKDKSRLNYLGKGTFDLKFNKIRNYEEVFADMESKLIKSLEANRGKDIIFMTHYVPSSEFAIYKNDMIWNANNSFLGSTRYQELAEEYKVKKVIFGHTHNRFNKTINGVDYHCNPIGYSNYEYHMPFSERVMERLFVIDI